MTDTVQMVRRSLEVLSKEIGPRPAGSEGQRRAAAYVIRALQKRGFDVEIQRTPCPEWELHDLSLRLGGEPLKAIANPYAPACSVSAPLVCVQSIDDLREAALDGSIAVLAGALTAAQFSPRNFDLFRDEAQDEILATLEQKRPLAVSTVADMEHPVPLIEDADFRLPSVTVSRSVGAALLAAAGSQAELTLRSVRSEGNTANIIARGRDVGRQRLVLCAHYDTKFYTPGAIDNGSGMACLLALAELLEPVGIELVAFGGEDSWYPNEVAYVQYNDAYLPTISAVINVDGIGVKGRSPSVAFLGCPDGMVQSVLGIKAGYPEIKQVAPWYEGDHSLFWPRGIPCIAVSTDEAHDLLNRIVHTPADTMEQVDVDQICRVTAFLREVIISHCAAIRGTIGRG